MHQLTFRFTVDIAYHLNVRFKELHTQTCVFLRMSPSVSSDQHSLIVATVRLSVRENNALPEIKGSKNNKSNTKLFQK